MTDRYTFDVRLNLTQWTSIIAALQDRRDEARRRAKHEHLPDNQSYWLTVENACSDALDAVRKSND